MCWFAAKVTVSPFFARFTWSANAPIAMRSCEPYSASASAASSRSPAAILPAMRATTRSAIRDNTLLREAPDCEADVMAAESERVAEHHVHAPRHRLVRRVVEVALRVRRLVADRRRNDVVLDRERAEDELDGARRSQHVAGGALGGTDVDAGRVRPEDRLDGLGLVQVVRRRGGAVRIDVLHAARLEPGVL